MKRLGFLLVLLGLFGISDLTAEEKPTPPTVSQIGKFTQIRCNDPGEESPRTLTFITSKLLAIKSEAYFKEEYNEKREVVKTTKRWAISFCVEGLQHGNGALTWQNIRVGTEEEVNLILDKVMKAYQ